LETPIRFKSVGFFQGLVHFFRLLTAAIDIGQEKITEGLELGE
jgi:hypothetical protein